MWWRRRWSSTQTIQDSRDRPTVRVGRAAAPDVRPDARKRIAQSGRRAVALSDFTTARFQANTGTNASPVWTAVPASGAGTGQEIRFSDLSTQAPPHRPP